ncbi:acid protease, partial [Fistulina hepatica ATCC 64428]
IATLRLGTPWRDFRLLIDSGSGGLWVASEHCQTTGGNSCAHTSLGPKSSSSFFENSTHEWAVQYGYGYVSGRLASDSIHVLDGFQLDSFTLGVADVGSEDVTGPGVPFDGILGLAKSALSTGRNSTLVDALYDHGLIDQPIVSYKIPRLADAMNDGEVTFGQLDTCKFDEMSLVSVKNIDPRGHWEVPIDAITIASWDMGWHDRTAVIDTGTTLVVVPQPDADAIHAWIPGAKFSNSSGLWTIPCNATTIVSLTFGGRPFPIDSRDLSFLPVDPKELGGQCISGIVAGVANADKRWLVGTLFLKNVYLSTNTATDTVSFARLK